MICRRCMRAALRTERFPTASQSLSIAARRTISSTASQSATVSPDHATQSAPRQGSPSSSHNPPAATSTSAAQPFSSALTPSAKNQDLPIAAGGKVSAPPVLVKSSVPAGTILKGLNFIKGKQDPVALEDSEYPSWLWGVLSEGQSQEASSGVNETDLFSKSKKQRRKTAKALRKQQLLNPESLAPKIPLYEQSIDLPGGDGSFEGALDAGQARDELTKAMRNKRRSAIKEDNFLRAMR